MHSSRFIHEPQLNRSQRVIPIPKGGHDGVTAPEGANNLDLLTNDQLNQALGVAGSDSNNYIHVSAMPVSLSSNATVNVTGLTSLEINQQTTYFITDYETFLNYTLTAISGVVSRTGDTITYTAPSSAGPGGFIINDREINIAITSSFTVNAPVITSPTNNATGVAVAIIATSNAFTIPGTTDTHQGTDWQVATDAGFTNIISQVTNSATNKLSYAIASLSGSTTYYVRARYKGTLYGYSSWSVAVAFTTQATATVNQPSVTAPINGSTTVATSPSFASTAFVVTGGSDTHQGSDWQVATDSGFTNIVAQVVNSSTNKVSYSVAGLTTGVTYYARVRYKGTSYGYSNWSSVISFTTSSTPTYNVSTTNSTYSEGNNINFNISTTNITNGTALYWTISGSGITSGDFNSGGLSGSVTINSNTAVVSESIASDQLTEGTESLTFQLRTGSTSGTIVASTTKTINDTSITPSIQSVSYTYRNIIPPSTNSMTAGQEFIAPITGVYTVTLTGAGGLANGSNGGGAGEVATYNISMNAGEYLWIAFRNVMYEDQFPATTNVTYNGSLPLGSAAGPSFVTYQVQKGTNFASPTQNGIGNGAESHGNNEANFTNESYHYVQVAGDGSNTYSYVNSGAHSAYLTNDYRLTLDGTGVYVLGGEPYVDITWST